jgi:hypothetical protein
MGQLCIVRRLTLFKTNINKRPGINFSGFSFLYQIFFVYLQKIKLKTAKMKNIHVLPTDKPTGIFQSNNGLQFSIRNKVRVGVLKGFHIYITSSNENCKEVDWWLNTKTNDVDKCTHKSEVLLYNSEKYQHIKKIILTTDQDLINDGVQYIPDEFLKWYINNPSCEMVDFEKHWEIDNWYRIIIPQEEPKTTGDISVDYSIAQSKAIQKCMQLDAEMAYKSLPKQEHSKYLSCCRSEEECHCGKNRKQETNLEEAAEKDFNNQKTYDKAHNRKLGFKAGAKSDAAKEYWFEKFQQEQDKKFYSEEEILYMLYSFKNYLGFGKVVDENKWFEQFEKK